MSQQQPPDPGAWAQIGDPAARLRAGLVDLYRFYRGGKGMLACLYRDFAALPEEQQRSLQEQAELSGDLLAAPLGGDASQRRLTPAVIGHAASFWTWHSLCVEHGLADQQAVDVMTSAVLAAAMAAPPGEPAQSPPRTPSLISWQHPSAIRTFVLASPCPYRAQISRSRAPSHPAPIQQQKES
ncbi:MAG TPA: hypothetical protein VLW44_15935 [Streptosporangiaceae bacterium]|nr:hypothetical protein [Streptosporangiaceae bacterium]